MEHRDWGRIQDIYDKALQLRPAERDRYIANECRNDPSTANEVNELLIAEESSTGFFKSPVFEMGLQIISGSEELDDLVGKKIGDRYVVIKQLEEGGMGRVFLARDQQLSDRLVIIKVLLDIWFKNPDAVERFKREVHALTVLDQHPNVVSVYDAGELDNGKPYVVMQYIDGATLRSVIPTQGMDLDRAASILKQIGTALEHIHAKGILHRDLKPENIMLQVLSDGTELVKIVDFGIAKIKDSVVAGTDTNIRIGTASYMSPEQNRGDKLTPASDVYAMAVIAHEIVTGKRPEHPVGSIRRAFSARAKKIIVRNLSFTPADRYQSAKRFGEDLHLALLMSQPRTTWPKVVAALLVVAFVSLAVYKYRENIFHGKGTTEPTVASRKGFNYWLSVQKMRDGKPYQDPTKMNGTDPLATGDQFQLNVTCLESGYLYIIHEQPPEPNKVSFRMIYPTTRTNDGSASIGANQTFRSEWILLKPPSGSENFWIVWSVTPINELESAKDQALKHPESALTNQTLISVKEFLKTMRGKIDVDVRRYEARQEATVRANSDLVLTLVEFKHR